MFLWKLLEMSSNAINLNTQSGAGATRGTKILTVDIQPKLCSTTFKGPHACAY